MAHGVDIVMRRSILSSFFGSSQLLHEPSSESLIVPCINALLLYTHFPVYPPRDQMNTLLMLRLAEQLFNQVSGETTRIHMPSPLIWILRSY
ncbi:unnamed protein product, partial [Allacma fusca]